MEASLHRPGWLNHLPSVDDLTSSPFPIPRGQGVGLKVPTLCSCLVPLATAPILRCFPKSSHQHKSSSGGKRLLWISRHPFHLYDFEAILGTEDKRPKIITKDAPIALITQKIPRVLGALSQKPWMKTKDIWELYFDHLNDQIYFLCHNITYIHNVSLNTLLKCTNRNILYTPL